MSKKNSCKAFTLAEVIITLIVIGVVAAITVPMMNNSVADKKWNVARQKAHATIAEAFKLATVNGDVTPEYDNTKDFVTKSLSKYLKINKQCDTAQACGFSSQVKRADGKSSRAIPISWTDSTAAKVINTVGSLGATTDYTTKYGTKFNNSTFFQTLDGFSVAFFYNPYCNYYENENYAENLTSKAGGVETYCHYALNVVCMNAVYDMNGKKGPNRVGQDIGFVGSLYNGYRARAVAVLPNKDEKVISQVKLPGSGNNYWARANQYCNELYNNDWKMPDIDELAILYLNWNILRTTTASAPDYFVSSKLLAGTNNKYWSYVFRESDSQRGRDGITPLNLTNPPPKILCVRASTLK